MCFEISEGAVIANLEHARRFIGVLHGMGCRFALDDFGSGIGSFSKLKLLAVDFLKIDGTFMRNLARDSVNQAMVTAMIKLARTLNFKVIAEQIEDDSSAEAARVIGADYLQGYAIGRPAPTGARRLVPCGEGRPLAGAAGRQAGGTGPVPHPGRTKAQLVRADGLRFRWRAPRSPRVRRSARVRALRPRRITRSTARLGMHISPSRARSARTAPMSSWLVVVPPPVAQFVADRHPSKPRAGAARRMTSPVYSAAAQIVVSSESPTDVCSLS